MSKIKELQNRFGDDDHIAFEQTERDVVLIHINHPQVTAIISLQGGQVLEWRPTSQAQPVLWSADPTSWLPSRAIRAGVPICWPWFGAHPTERMAPAHGYARLCDWEVTAISKGPLGTVDIDLSMVSTYEAAMRYPLSATLTTRISVGEALSISLTTINTGADSITITEALHAYFNVGDIDDIQIQGLDGCDYIDLIDQNIRKAQVGSVRFTSETGKVFLNTLKDCFIIDRTLGRTVKIEKSGSHSTVVWNPWLETAAKMSDLGPIAWKKMVCVESANAFDNFVTLEPGGQHTLAVKYLIETSVNSQDLKFSACG
jgi:D-hexose-6-phosphate mutarotase